MCFVFFLLISPFSSFDRSLVLTISFLKMFQNIFIALLLKPVIMFFFFYFLPCLGNLVPKAMESTSSFLFFSLFIAQSVSMK